MTLDLLIGDTTRPAEGGRSYDRRNPFDGSVASMISAALFLSLIHI